MTLFMVISTGLDKYSSYKVRVAASTAVGESPMTDEDYIFVVTLEDGIETIIFHTHAEVLLHSLGHGRSLNMPLSVF